MQEVLVLASGYASARKEFEVKKSVISCVLCALIMLLLPAAREGSLASLRHVPSEQYATIQSAIDASAWGDTVLVGPGVYEETLQMITAVSLISSDGPAKTTIDGGGQGVCLTCRQVMDSTAVIRGFTFKGGVGLHGGGVFLNTSFVTVEGNTFLGDSAKYGGGICALWSNSSIKNNTFSSNRASYGGALYTMFISPRIDSNVVESNSALIGGGIYIATSSEATVRGNLIRGNRAGRGGGVFLNTAFPVLEGNTIWENWAEEGGGISSLRSSGAIRQNVLWKNQGQRGAAIAVADTAAPDIERNTIAFNSASDTLCAGLYTTAVFTRVVGNIFFANSPGYAVYCDKEAAPVMSCNIMWGNETGDYLGLQSETADIYQDPLFCDAANGDFTLREGSPALSGPCGPMGALSRGCGAEQEEE